jgi:hypothetical protein
MELGRLPGGDLVRKGLADLAESRETIEAFRRALEARVGRRPWRPRNV